jgi:hypothetical protein
MHLFIAHGFLSLDIGNDNHIGVLVINLCHNKKIGTLSVHVSAHGNCTVAKGFNQYSVPCKNFKGLMFNK